MGVEAGGVERGDTPSLPEDLKPEVSSAPHNKKEGVGHSHKYPVRNFHQ